MSWRPVWVHAAIGAGLALAASLVAASDIELFEPIERVVTLLAAPGELALFILYGDRERPSPVFERGLPFFVPMLFYGTIGTLIGLLCGRFRYVRADLKSVS